MKNKIYGLVVLVCLIIAPNLVWGQSLAETRRENRPAERQAKISEIMGQRLGNLEQMFELRLNWLENITGRLESRMTKLTEGGVDVSEARTKLATAKTALAAARDQIAGLMDQVEAALTSDTPLQSFKTVKNNIKGLSDEIKAVHRQLIEVITSLKAAIK